MTRVQRLMYLHRLMAPETGGEGGSTGGSTGASDGAGTGTGGSDGTGSDGGKQGEGEGGKTSPGPSDAEAKLLKENMTQKAKLKELNDQIAALTLRFDGIDPDAVRALQAQQAEEERLKAEKRGEYDRLLKQMGEQHTAALAKERENTAAALAQASSLQAQIADLTIGGAFSNSSFVRDDLTLTPSKARVIYGAHFEFKDGAVVAFDKPAGASERTPLVDAAGRPLDFESAMRKLIESDPDKDRLLRAKTKPGAGSGTDAGAKKGQASGEAPQLTGAARIAAGLRKMNLASA